LWGKNPDANIAIHPGRDYVYIDLDVKHGKDGYASLAEYLGVAKGSIPRMTYSVETASGGLHMYFSVDKPQSPRANILSGVDVRGLGSHVVAPGSTIFTKDEFGEMFPAEYRVVNDAPVVAAPDNLLVLLRESREKSERAQVSMVEGATDHPAAIDHMRDLLKKRKPAVQGEGGDAHTLVTVLQCRDHDISADACLELLTEEGGWNDRCDPPWGLDELKVKVENAYKYAKSPPGNRGGALLEMADEGGFLSEDSELPPDIYDLPDDSEEPKGSKFEGHLYDANTFMQLELDYSFVIDGWIPDQGYSAVLAKRGGGKTTAIMDMVCHLACDRDWHDTVVERGYTIVYISGEDTPGVKARLQAWCMKTFNRERMPDPSRFMIFDMTIDLVNPEEVRDYALFIRKETELKEKVLFVIDTWQRMTALSEGQSDEKDMQKAVMNLEALCRSFKGPSIIAVHPPKANSTVISGSGIIENNSQAIITIGDPSADIREIRTGRVKGAPEGLVKRMKIVSQPISGFTKRGRRMTGALFEYHGGTVGESRELETSDTEMRLLQVTADMIRNMRNYYPDYNKPVVVVGDVAKLAYDVYKDKGASNPLGEKWYRELISVGYTEYEVLGLDGFEFRAARSPIMRQIEALRARNGDDIDLKQGGKHLVFKRGKGRGYSVSIEQRADIESLPEESEEEADDL
jgi:hypothetical protein